MKPFAPLFIIATLIFLAGILASIFGHLNPGNMPLVWITLAVTIIYLFSGWHIFKGYFPAAHPFLLFLTGYLYAGVFISFSFHIANWPLSKTLLTISPIWSLAVIAIAIIFRKKMPKEGLIQFLIEAIIMLTLTILILAGF